MDNFDELSLKKLSHKNLKQINGGVLLGYWGSVLKGARYLLEAAGAIDAIIDFKEGYQECRCQS